MACLAVSRTTRGVAPASSGRVTCTIATASPRPITAGVTGSSAIAGRSTGTHTSTPRGLKPVRTCTLYLRPSVEVEPLAYAGAAREFRGTLHLGLEDSLDPAASHRLGSETGGSWWPSSP